MPDFGHGLHFQIPDAFAEATGPFIAADLRPSHYP
jgi:hypothetical protein